MLGRDVDRRWSPGCQPGIEVRCSYRQLLGCPGWLCQVFTRTADRFTRRLVVAQHHCRRSNHQSPHPYWCLSPEGKHPRKRRRQRTCSSTSVAFTAFLHKRGGRWLGDPRLDRPLSHAQKLICFRLGLSADCQIRRRLLPERDSICRYLLVPYSCCRASGF